MRSIAKLLSLKNRIKLGCVALFFSAFAVILFAGNPAARAFSDFPRTTTRFEDVIAAERTGWIKMWLTNDAAMIGAALNFNPSKNAAVFNHGHNLRKLTLTHSATLTIPVFPSSC